MTLEIGTRLGSYEIGPALGAGGMGEVYRARDMRLARDVAIKVLPPDVSADAGRLERFEKEARTASSLSHPNIVTIYEIGTSDSSSYIAMELVEGKTLREWLHAGALPLRRLLSLAAQTADGLAKAHEAGIVHRDLKPENVMVTGDGRVKILDFGLAKMTQPDSDSAGSDLLTITRGTEPGIVMGTVGYMSPEQASGHAVDYRSDQFSFGSILYEMATGKRAFSRPTAAQTLAAIIQDEPEPIATINPKVPAPLRWIIERCLAKEARKRFASTEDLANDLATLRDHLSEATSGAEVFPKVTLPERRRSWWIRAAISGVLLLALGLIYWPLRERDYFWKNPLAEARFTRFTDWQGSERDAGISPDGKFVVFLSDRAGPVDAWLGQVGGREFLNLTGGRFANLSQPPQVRVVGFSDDGAHVTLLEIPKAVGRVWLIPTIGGSPQLFLQSGVSLAWSPDKKQLVYHTGDPGDPLFIADRTGRNPMKILEGRPGLHNHFPTWAPDGRFIYYTHGVPPDDMDIWRIRSAGGAPERLTSFHSTMAYPTFIDDRTLLYTVVDEDGAWRLYAMDVARRIPHRLSSGLEEYTSLSSSTDGRHLAAAVANPTLSLWFAPISDRVVDDSGLQQVSLATVRAADPRFGPDYLVYRSARGGPFGLWKLKDGVETELWKGSEGEVAAAPAVSKDGTQVAFVVRRGGRTRLYAMSSDGTNARSISEALDVHDAPSWSPDSRWIAVIASEGDAKPLFKVPVDGGKPVRLAEGILLNPVWSPDGRFILISDGQRGGGVVRLRAVTPDGRPFPLPELPEVGHLGNRYRFLPDGRNIVVMQGVLWKQNFELLDLTTGARRRLTDLSRDYNMRSFDVSPDGKQILFDRYRDNSDIVLIDLPPR